MGLIEIILTIALLGLIVWAVTTFIPMPEKFKQVIYVVAGVFLLLWLIGLLTGHAPRIRLGAADAVETRA